MQLQMKCTFELLVMNRLSVAVGIVILSIGAFFLYVGQRTGDIHGGFVVTTYGALMVIMGIIFILWGIFKKGKTNIFFPP
jgi:hypothetical protein